MSDEEKPTYLLRRPSCGHVVGLCVDEPTWKKEAAKFCADGIRRGLAVERVTVGAVRDGSIGDWCLSTCPESPNYPKAKRPKNQGDLFPAEASK